MHADERGCRDRRASAGRLSDRTLALPALALARRRRRRDAGAGRRRGRRHPPGYKLKLNSYDLGVDIELHDALQRIRFEHPAGAARRHHRARSERVFCSGANIFMLGAFVARVEGELLQVHQRDAQRPRGLEPPLGAQVRSPRSTAPAPAAATSSRSPATRSCWSTIARRRCRCPRSRCSACCRAPAA